jgi:hypothetical protein
VDLASPGFAYTISCMQLKKRLNRAARGSHAQGAVQTRELCARQGH